jgi:hypothetical protein
MKKYDVTLQIIIVVKAKDEEDAFFKACNEVGVTPAQTADYEAVEMEEE